jgi:hypothetical protein
MSFQVEYQKRRGYLYVHVLGERSLEAVITLTKELTEKAIELQFQRLLVDVRGLKGWLPPVDTYEIVNREFVKYRGRGIGKVAILDREFPDARAGNFLQTAAQNRGFNLSVHTQLKPAIAWLTKGLDTEPVEE